MTGFAVARYGAAHLKGKGIDCMALYQRGSQGSEVVKTRTRPREIAPYAGPIDEAFGGGTENVVLQQARTLDVRVGPIAASFAGQEMNHDRLLRLPLLLVVSCRAQWTPGLNLVHWNGHAARIGAQYLPGDVRCSRAQELGSP
jgi:hypothetical protein